MNYKTYAEAKIANPDSEIVTTGENLKWAKNSIGTFLPCNASLEESERKDEWVICNPADYCLSLKDYFDAGFKLVAGDKIIGVDKSVFDIAEYTEFNEPDEEDCERYILSAAALNGGCKIPAKAEQWTIYNNTLPLCELTDKQVGKLVKHSGCVEHMNPNSGEWGATIAPMWNRSGIYRIKPKSDRELFIDKSMEVFKENQHNKAEFMLGKIYDAGARYKDLTQHFGENI